MAASDPAWLTRKEAAELLRISPRHLDRLSLPRSYAAGPRSPRYSRESLAAFMQSATVQPERTETLIVSRRCHAPRVSLSGLGHKPDQAREWRKALMQRHGIGPKPQSRH